ncbi:Hypothetical predicted protein, partial [Paramuricea clavata]
MAPNPEAAWICISCFCPLSSSTTSDLNPEPGNPKTDQEPDIRLRRGLKIAHLNVNRLICKFDEIKKLIEKHSFDFLALSETWLTSSISDDELNISGYTFARKDRSDPAKSQGGGVLVYVKSGIPYSIISSQPNSTDEQIWIDVARPH